MSSSDDSLMQATAAGDAEAFKALVELWEKRVYGFAWRSLGSADDAQDIAQETFLRVYANASRYRPGRRFESWLFRIAGNLIRNEIRRRKVRKTLSLDFGPGSDNTEFPDSKATPEDRYQSGRLAEAMHAAILSLPERQRVALILKRFESMKQSGIAEVLGISEKAVESLLSRGMAALRKQFKA